MHSFPYGSLASDLHRRPSHINDEILHTGKLHSQEKRQWWEGGRDGGVKSKASGVRVTKLRAAWRNVSPGSGETNRGGR